MQQKLAQFHEAGIHPVAISVDPPETNRGMLAQAGYTFLFLSDPKAEAIRSYDLVHAGQGENGGDISRPAEFIVDTSGTVRWVNLTENYWVRARPEQILEVTNTLR